MSTQVKQVVFVGLAVTLIAFMIWMLRPQGAAPIPTAVGAPGASAPVGQSIDQKLQQQVIALQDQVQKDPKNVKALTELGDLLFDMQQYARAADTYNSALDLAPNDANVRTDLALSYFYQGMTKTAIKEFRQAIQTDPNKIEARFNLALALSHSSPPDVEGAIAEWQQVIKIAPNSDSAKKSQAFIDSYQKAQK